MPDAPNNAAILDGKVALTTGRLKLRGFRPEDLDAHAAMNADPHLMEYLGARPLTRLQSDAIAFGAQCTFMASGFGKIAVERIEDSAFVGTCGLSLEPWYPDHFEIGWRLARKYWGQGYASEAAAAWLDHAFSTMKLPRVISIADAPNARSIAVMKRIGMHFDHAARLTQDGEAFDAVIYARMATPNGNR